MSKITPQSLSWLVAFILWLVLWAFTNLVAPENWFSISVFFIILFAAIFTSTFVFFHRIRRNLIISLYLVSLPVLQYFHLFSWLNFILVTGFFTTTYLLDTN